MEGLLEATTYRTLHAHNFARSSSQATYVLTDLLARYLSLLSSGCAKYAQHAGRLNLTVQDALSALDEMGVNMAELEEYGKSEGRELGRYAFQTARRFEDLREIKTTLLDGLGHDRDDYVHLNYGLVPEEEEEEEEEESEEEPMSVLSPMAVDVVEPISERIVEDVRPPPLPLSPVSNPASPSRRRPRLWDPPAHIPGFLPAFPVAKDSSAPNSPEQPLQPELPPQRTDKPLSPLPQVSTSTSSSDYLTPVPYSQSSLATIPAWHLPAPPSAPPQLQSSFSRLPTPQIQPALLGAYHHILTHPPSKNATSANPSRHRVALSLLYQTETNPRWEPADTMFSISVPNAPRVSSMPPSHPVPKNQGPNDKTDPDNRPILPSVSPYPITNVERITPLMSQQGSRIPESARSVLSPSVYLRATRLIHPPPLKRGAQTLVYGPGTPAPWNATNALAPAPPPPKKDEKPALNGKSKEEPPPVLPDAKYYATWDYESKSFKEPLVLGRKKIGSMQSSINLKAKIAPPA